MSDGSAMAFVSYTHNDDADSGGALIELANRIAAEHRLLTGRPIELFVDRTSLGWGDAWRDRVNDALAESTFFIAFLTPSFFESLECRREMKFFVEQARRSSKEHLLLPILYTTVSGISESSEDEFRALIATVQWEDWRALRLVDGQSAAYLQAVNRMAKTIRDRTELSSPDKTFSRTEEPEPLGLAELAAEVDELVPVWLAKVLGNRVWVAQTEAVNHTWFERIRKLERQGRTGGPMLGAVGQMCAQVEPLLQEHLDSASVYLEYSRALDKLVPDLVVLVEENPEFDYLLDNLRDGVSEAVEAIATWERQMPQDQHAPPYNSLVKYNRSAHRMQKIVFKSIPYINVGNSIVLGWAASLGIDASHILNAVPTWYTEGFDV